MKIVAIKQCAKTGEESLTDVGNPIGFSLLDFWRWSVSDSSGILFEHSMNWMGGTHCVNTLKS